MALSKKQRAFVEHYLRCWNASEAARRAGYSEKTAGQQGSRLLKKVEIQERLEARLEEVKMSANEVLTRLSQQARGEYARHIRVIERSDPDTGARWTEPTFDLAECEADGNLHLIKKWKYDAAGRLEVEFDDKYSALVQLGRAHGLFTDKTDVTSGGEAIQSDDDIRQDILGQLSRIASGIEASRVSGQPDD